MLETELHHVVDRPSSDVILHALDQSVELSAYISELLGHFLHTESAARSGVHWRAVTGNDRKASSLDWYVIVNFFYTVNFFH